jgi:hypothetical protein
METGFSTPLLDMFRNGEVERDVKLLAAQGELAPRALEQLGLLSLLHEDADPEIAGTAQATLQSMSRESIAASLARSDAPAELRAFFAARGIEPAPAGTADAADADDVSDVEAEKDEKDDQGSALQRLSGMNVPQKLNRASKGTREERAILIRDPNKMIAAAVLSCPKVTASEAESFARAGNVSVDVLRTIAGTRAWMKNYNVVYALAKNPKTPVGISMNLLSRLTEKDLRVLSTDRNVPDVLRITARKKVVIDK